AGEDDFVFCGGPLRNRPVERLARTAELVFFRGGIEEEIGRAAESFEIGHGKTGVDAKSPDDGQSVLETVEMLRRFVAVKLDGGQLECVDKIHGDFGLPVDKNADGLGGGSEFAANVPGVGGSDGSGGFFVKIQPDRPSAEFFGETGVLRASDSADFHEG